MKNKKTPAIRFKGFTDDWEQRKLGELVEFNPSEELPDEFEYVDLESVVGTEMITHRHENKATAPSRAQRVARQGDLFYQTVRPYQKNNYLFDKPDNDYVFSTGYAQMRPYIDGHFLLDLVQTERFVKVVLDNCTGTSYPAINANDLASIKITYPQCRSEQQTIGIFLASIDTLITLHQRKLEKLKNFKKAMLEKMFPKNSEKTPKIRFQGFTDDWEQRKLGECFDERCEKLPGGELISVTINSGIKKFSELGRYNGSNEDKSKYKKVCIGDIAYNSMRMWQGASGYSPYEGIVSPAYTVLKSKKGIHSMCVAYLFKCQEMIHIFQLNSQGITSDSWNLKFPALSQIEIKLARQIEEQRKISDYFKNLDISITLHQRKLEKLQQIKKAMLEKMFV